MAAIDFPSSPSNGDTHTVGGVTYTYNSAETKWKTTINSNAFLPLTGGTVSGNIVLDGELQHSGDIDTNIAFDTDTILFDTAGSERFRVGSAGQLGIGGATYGTSGQVLTSGGASAAPSWADASNLTRGTAVSASGSSSVDFTSLPAGVRKITLFLDDVSTSATANIFFRIGDSGGFESTGYISTSNRIYSSAVSDDSSTTDWRIRADSDSDTFNGAITCYNVTGNTWVSTHVIGRTQSTLRLTSIGGGTKTLSGELDRIQIAVTSGTFDAGTVNIIYEV